MQVVYLYSFSKLPKSPVSVGDHRPTQIPAVIAVKFGMQHSSMLYFISVYSISRLSGARNWKTKHILKVYQHFLIRDKCALDELY